MIQIQSVVLSPVFPITRQNWLYDFLTNLSGLSEGVSANVGSVRDLRSDESSAAKYCPDSSHGFDSFVVIGPLS